MNTLGPAWTHDDAVELCTLVESVCPRYGCHVALTGGTLYKTGPRKDVDIVLYRIRQVERIDIEGLFHELLQHGIARSLPSGRFENDHQEGGVFVIQAAWEGKRIDFLLPDFTDGYPTAPTAIACRGCKREIVIARSVETGKLMPFEADADGEWVIANAEASRQGRAPQGYSDAVPRWTSHFVRCPAANDGRKR